MKKLFNLVFSVAHISSAVCVPGKKSDLWWWWWWLYSGAAQVKQRDCRTCRASQGRAGWAMVTGRRPTEETKDSDRKTGAAEKRELRTRNTDRMSAGPGRDCPSHHPQTSTHHLNTAQQPQHHY